MSFRNNYHISVDQHQIPDNLLAATKNRMDSITAKPGRNKILWRVAVPVCSFAMVISLTALAYKFTGGFTNSPDETVAISNVSLKANQQADNQEKKTIEKNGLYMTINNVKCDKERTSFNFEVQSKDGTPLKESSEFRKTMLGTGSWGPSKVLVGDKEYTCYIYSRYSESDNDKLIYDCKIIGDLTKQNGAQANLVVKNIKDRVKTCEDAGFLFDNLGDLYKKMTPENPDNFIKTGLYEVYANKSLIAPSWTIPAGKQHVAFSSQFPNSYIDNIGFHKTGEYGCQVDGLYISITPGNDEDAVALKKLCFQNIKTKIPVKISDFWITGNGIEQVGFNSEEDYQKAWQAEQDRKLSFNGNRIVIELQSDSGKDCTVEDLQNYRIMKNFSTDNVSSGANEWRIPFTIQFTGTTNN